MPIASRQWFTGIELDPHYCEIAERRISDASDGASQMELF